MPHVPFSRLRSLASAGVLVLSLLAGSVRAQDGPPPPFGGPGGPGGPGMGMAEQKIAAKFDKDGDGHLNAAERKEARAFLKEQRANAPRREGGPRMGPRAGNAEPPKPGAQVKPEDVKTYPEAGLYDPRVLRTLFLEFENADWDAELADFRGTDVDVPATLTVDGKKYAGVGARYRGASSYFMVAGGYKRSFNLSIDELDKKQRLHGVKTLNLLNANGDPTFLRSALYSMIASRYVPTPKVNLVKVVVNGENWGIYVNQEQFGREFLNAWYPSSEGVRWKVPGSPRGGGGLAYKGDDPAAYERQYEIKTDDAEDAKKGWSALVKLCATLEKTPPEKLEEALTPILDIDGVLRFLALENVLMNEDGYWIRASDFSLFLDPKGKFHVLPHDINETFVPAGGGPGGPGGPGGRRGPGGFDGPPPGSGPRTGPESRPGNGPQGSESRPGRPRAVGIALDPLAGMGDADKPLLTRLLAVPKFKERYLEYVKAIAENDLDWKKLEPFVRQTRDLIDAEVKADTRKLESYDAFTRGIGLDAVTEESRPAGGGRPSLEDFVAKRRAFLLAHDSLQGVKSISVVPPAVKERKKSK